MPITLPTVQTSIPDPLFNESLSPPNHLQGQWTVARKMMVCFLAFVGVCILLQMSRARKNHGAEKVRAAKKPKEKKAPSTHIDVSITNGIIRYSNAPDASPIKESGVQKQEEKRLTFFNAVEIRLPASVKIEKGEVQKVTLAADRNIFDRLVAKVEGARLILEAQPHTAFETRQPINYTIVVPSLIDLKVITAATVSISTLKENSFKCWLESSAQVEVQGGLVTKQEINVCDTATYLGRYLTSDKTSLQVCDAGKVHVKAVRVLTGTVEDNGECHYYGEPLNSKTIKISDNGKINCQTTIYVAV